MKTIGIFGGTFNPPHLGHLILAETAADSLNLDRVFFVTSADPAHKQNMPHLAPAEYRYEMVQQAIDNNPRFEASRADMDRPGPHYAIDMLQNFKDQYPDTDLYFLMGSDSLRDLLSWSQPEKIIQMVNLVVMQRPDMYPDLASLTRHLPGMLERVYFLDAPEIEISSTDIVNRLQQSLSIRYRVPETVFDYLNDHKLYEK